MILLALLVACLLTIMGSLYFYPEDRRNILILFIIGFFVGLFVEIWGVSSGQWEYQETDLFYVADVPIEIVVFYGTGLLLAGLSTIVLTRARFKHDRYKTIVDLLPMFGIFCLIFSLVDAGKIPIGIPLLFFALWGLSVSKKKEIPLTIGVMAFFTDIIIEGGLAITTNYYDWTFSVALAFMLAGVFFGGFFTREKCTKDKDLCFV